MLPTVGAALIIIFCSKETLTGKNLGSQVLLRIGLISYSAYLWHQPVFAYARLLSVREPSQLTFVALSLLSLLLAHLSWRYIEVPFRKSTELSRKSIFLFTSTGSLLFICIGLLGAAFNGLPSRYPYELREIASLTLKDVNTDRNRLNDQICATKTHDIVCGSIKPDSANILILGDSHGPDGLNVFAQVFPNANFLVSQQPGCPLIKDLAGVTFAYGQCDSFNKRKFSLIKSLSQDIDLVVLSQRMSFARLEGTKHTINWIHNNGTAIAVLGAGPEYERDVLSLVLRHRSVEGLNEKLSESSILSQYGVDEKIEPLVKNLGGYYIKKRPIFCPQWICGGMLPDRNLLMFDKQHLTLSGANWLGKAISKDAHALKNLMKNR